MADWDGDAPQGNDLVSQFPQNERNARKAVKTNFGVDHHETDDADVGKHEQVTLLEQGSDPSAASGQGRLFTKDVNGVIELFWIDSDGNVIQLTSGGSVSFEIVRMLEQSSDPSATSDQGKLYTKDVNGVTELFWIDSDGNAGQLTTNGTTDARKQIQFNNVFVQWEKQQELDGVVNSLSYGDGLYIAGTGNSTVWSSPNGREWVNQASLDGVVNSTIYDENNSLFVAGTANDTIWTSPDGQTWTNQMTLDGSVTALFYANDLLLAGTNVGSIWSSTDGQSWTNQQTLSGSVLSFSFGNSLFIAGTSAGSVWSSSDGETWAEQQTLSSEVDNDVNALAFDGSFFIAGVDDSTVWSSSDGQTWTERQTLNDSIISLTSGDGLSVAGAGGLVWASLDGQTWTEQKPQFGGFARSLAYGDSLFIAGTALDSVWAPFRPPASFTV